MPVELSPSNTEEMAAALRECAQKKLTLAVVGGGTKPAPGRKPALDAVIRTAKMARILEHSPSDMVLACEAGATLAQVQAKVRQHRQRLAIDPPWPERATVGGIIACNDFGPRRARYGAVRDLIIGITLVRADGVIAKSGGKVVKNVAGFDLPKVMCGSLGTLAAIATATFRLHPMPEASATVRAAGLGAAEVVALLERVHKSQLEPTSAAALRSTEGRYELALRFEGFGKGVEQQTATALTLGAERLDDPAAAALWARHDRVRIGGPVRLKMASLPSRLASLDPLIAAIGGECAWYGTLGLGFVAAETATSAAVQALRAALIAGGGSLVIEAAPDEIVAAVDAWGPTPPAFALMKSLKQRFDPEGRLNPGRSLGGL